MMKKSLLTLAILTMVTTACSENPQGPVLGQQTYNPALAQNPAMNPAMNPGVIPAQSGQVLQNQPIPSQTVPQFCPPRNGISASGSAQYQFMLSPYAYYASRGQGSCVPLVMTKSSQRVAVTTVKIRYKKAKVYSSNCGCMVDTWVTTDEADNGTSGASNVVTDNGTTVHVNENAETNSRTAGSSASTSSGASTGASTNASTGASTVSASSGGTSSASTGSTAASGATASTGSTGENGSTALTGASASSGSTASTGAAASSGSTASTGMPASTGSAGSTSHSNVLTTTSTAQPDPVCDKLPLLQTYWLYGADARAIYEHLSKTAGDKKSDHVKRGDNIECHRDGWKSKDENYSCFYTIQTREVVAADGTKMPMGMIRLLADPSKAGSPEKQLKDPYKGKLVEIGSPAPVANSSGSGAVDPIAKIYTPDPECLLKRMATPEGKTQIDADGKIEAFGKVSGALKCYRTQNLGDNVIRCRFELDLIEGKARDAVL